MASSLAVLFSCRARAFARRSSSVSSSGGFWPQPGNLFSSVFFFPKNDVIVACFLGAVAFFFGIG